MIYTDGPIVLPWEDIDFIRVTLETPYKNGGLRFRLGTTDAKRNLDFNPYDKRSGPPSIPGTPIMYPDKAPAIAGDLTRDSWIMPASWGAMTMTRKGEPIRDGARHAGYTAFGFFMAPLEEDPQLVGFTLSLERARVASFWHQFKFPPDRANKGLTHPLMSRIAAPDVPDVTVRFLDKQMQPLPDVAIRVRQFWNFDDPTQYELADDAALPAQSEVGTLLQGLTPDEVKALIAIARKGAAGAK